MLTNLPSYLSITFFFTTALTLILFIRAIKNSTSKAIRDKAILIASGLIIWLIIQAILSINHTYSVNTNYFPPKILILGILPTLFTILILFVSNKGKQFIDSLPLKNLTYLNIVRVPVEVVLYWLFMYNLLPELMTFEGRNFDILAGITAPIIAYFGYSKHKISKKGKLIWNLLSLALLLNIVFNALLSAPSPIQQFGFEQPNIAILYFPFTWLPTFIVPIVLLTHLVAIRQLLLSKEPS